MLVTAKLIKRKTDDEMMEIGDNVSLGKIYKVDLSTKQMVKGYNWEKGKIWEREMIRADGDWFPTELLEIEEQNASQREGSI